MKLHGRITNIGDWMLVRWGITPGTKIDVDKRCRKCNSRPMQGAYAWINFRQPYIYCQDCFARVAL